jgi:hypothetical protein
MEELESRDQSDGDHPYGLVSYDPNGNRPFSWFLGPYRRPYHFPFPVYWRSGCPPAYARPFLPDARASLREWANRRNWLTTCQLVQMSRDERWSSRADLLSQPQRVREYQRRYAFYESDRENASPLDGRLPRWSGDDPRWKARDFEVDIDTGMYDHIRRVRDTSGPWGRYGGCYFPLPPPEAWGVPTISAVDQAIANDWESYRVERGNAQS